MFEMLNGGLLFKKDNDAIWFSNFIKFYQNYGAT